MHLRCFVFAGFLLSLITTVPPAAADDAGRLVGVWRCETSFNGFAAVVDTVFQPNGSFSGMLQSSSGFMSRHWGTYQVGDGFIRFTYEGHEPRQFCGPLGCQDLHMPGGETVYYRFLGDGRLETRTAVCAFPPCGCVSTKIQ